MFHNCSLLKIKNGGDDWDRTNCDVSRKIYSLLPYHYGGISKFGWPTWARTRDILINSQTLYQLSYRPKNYGLGRKNRTSVSWSQTTNSTIKLTREKLVEDGRIELPLHACKAHVLPLSLIPQLVPQDGIEPPHPAYKTGPLPLRIQGHKNLAALGGNDPHSSGVTSQRASMNTLRPNKDRLLASTQAPN